MTWASTRIGNRLGWQIVLAVGLLFFPAVCTIASPLAYPAPSEEERPAETETVANWSIAPRERRPFAPPDARPTPAPASPSLTQTHAGPALARAASVDPFRNGLGAPYRC
jgi:hypothetical protein